MMMKMMMMKSASLLTVHFSLEDSTGDSQRMIGMRVIVMMIMMKMTNKNKIMM